MASSIQVVLKENVDKLGKAGDLVKVKPGYARNYLIPRLLAVTATRGNIAQLEHERAAVMANVAKLKRSAEDLAKQLSKVTIKIAKPAGDGDKLYGSVTAKEIAEALVEKGFELDRKKLDIPGSLKQLGEYEIAAKLGSEVTASFKLIIEKQSSE